MKNTKRIFLALLILTMVIACVFAMASCNKDKDKDNDKNDNTTTGTTEHTHTMVDRSAKAATCSEDGYKAYRECECGHKEGYEVIPKLSHNYISKITEYPSTNKTGKKVTACSVCGHVDKEETINAFTAALPNVSESLASMIAEGTYTMNVKKGSTLVFVKELSDYSVENGEKNFLAIDIAEAQLDSNDGLVTGYIKIAFGMATKPITEDVPASEVTAPATFTETGAIEIYLNGDAVSISISENNDEIIDEEYSINKIVFEALADELGMTYDDLAALMHFTSELSTVLPSVEKIFAVLEGIKTPSVTEEYLEGLAELISILGQDMIGIETDAYGNTTYTLNIEALAALVEAVEGKNVSEILDNMYGAGTAAALEAFVNSIPGTTVKDLVDNAITLAENMGMDTAKVFELIDLLIYTAGGEKICIQSELQKNYNKTVADLLAEAVLGSDATAQDKSEFISEFKNELTKTVDQVLALTTDEIFALYIGDDEATLEYLKELINAFNDMILVELTIDAEGNFTSLVANMDDKVVLEIVNSDAGFVASLTSGTSKMELTIEEDEISFVITEDDVVTTTATVTYTEFVEDGYSSYSINIVLSSLEDEVLDTIEAEIGYVNMDTLHSIYLTIDEMIIEGSVNVDPENPYAEIVVWENLEVTASVNLSYTETEIEDLDIRSLTLTFSAIDDETGVLDTTEIKIEYVNNDSLNGFYMYIDEVAIGLSIFNDDEMQYILFEVQENESQILAAGAAKLTTITNDITLETYEFILEDDKNTLLDASINFENGTITNASVEINIYETSWNDNDEPVETFKNYMTATLEKDLLEDDKYTLTITVENESGDGTETAIFDITATDNGFEFETTIDDETYTGYVNVVETENSLTFDAVIMLDDVAIFDYGFAISSTENGVAYEIHMEEDGVTIYEYAYAVTTTDNGVKYEMYLEEYGNVIFDLDYALEASNNTLTFKYDIRKLSIPEFGTAVEDGAIEDSTGNSEPDYYEAEYVYDYEYFSLEGKGEISITIDME